MNIRLAKAISTYYKLEHSLTSLDCVKMQDELEALTHFLEMGEIAIEEEREYQKKLELQDNSWFKRRLNQCFEYQKKLELQDKQNNQLRIVKPKERATDIEDEQD